MLEKVKETVTYIKSRVNSIPEVGIILGTGLGGLVRDIKGQLVLNYADIPNFPVSTVEGHKGHLIFGTLGGKCVVAMQGRFHFYEGYSIKEVTFPVRVMKFLGVKHLFVSNASGGVNPDFEIGDLMIINDHINLIPNPLIGPNDNEFGPRFPDMSQPYDHRLIALAQEVAAKQGVKMQIGCYVGTTGPTFETPKEYQFFRIIGGDAVGMSTVPEVIVARQMGLPVFAISIITDLGVPGKIVEITHEEVQRIGQQAEQKMTRIMEEMLQRL
ncbi:MAG: purine-nucleoside phosphorylase [Tenuifilaceae bacterium]|jgi:purine-nucleoside phosphorylase|nr:purine-nucleoside phosphorylase [Bacteroidales bacterium]MDI9517554.1 purine-nucleoside phosphorylase [Bacteroidota bacterium]NLH55639.1 purine-nucleoside phosphorylase [Rikenellaceae bacterium]OQC64484.1 MAG: Purine nucleoside phosphorylase 1 [Bacteroidetes bacterium ADurb.Bin008]HOF90901.1 purine-nucleoside phosphorylase [Tenuifilaceae bacterium]